MYCGGMVMELIRHGLKDLSNNIYITDFEEGVHIRYFNPIAKCSNGKFSARKFKMSKEMVERYIRLEKNCIKAWEEFMRCVPKERPDLERYFAGWEAGMEACWEEGWWIDDLSGLYLLRQPLWFDDEAYHILDAWDRAKEYQRVYLEKVKSLYESTGGELAEDSSVYYIVNGQEVKGAEYRELPYYKGGDTFTKKMVVALNLIAKEFNEFWLPLIREQDHDIYFAPSDNAEYEDYFIKARGLVGTLVQQIIEVQTQMYATMTRLSDAYKEVSKL